MRYFKLIVDPKEAGYHKSYKLKKNEIYSQEVWLGKEKDTSIIDLVSGFPEEWQEVFLLTQEHLDEVRDLHERIDKISTAQSLDPWEGVEFLESIWSNKIYPINQINGYKKGQYGYKPSTEEAYKSQLEKIALEKYGEIKAGDKFDRTPISEYWGIGEIEPFDNSGFDYIKHNDTLYFNGFAIYRQGKWSTKLDTKTKVISKNCMGEAIDDKPKDCDYSFHFTIANRLPKHDASHMYNKVLPFLKEQLEKYLNGELETDKGI